MIPKFALVARADEGRRYCSATKFRPLEVSSRLMAATGAQCFGCLSADKGNVLAEDVLQGDLRHKEHKEHKGHGGGVAYDRQSNGPSGELRAGLVNFSALEGFERRAFLLKSTKLTRLRASA